METVKVTNRGVGVVVYTVQLDNGAKVRREFHGGETFLLPKDEIRKLSYQPGGRTLIMEYLLVQDMALVKEISQNVEQEYWWTDDEVKRLLTSGSLDEFLDCLDFAPEGVIDLVKKYAVSLPLNDVEKRKALLDKHGFDVTKVLQHEEEAKQDDEAPTDSSAPQRRVKAKEETPTRRTPPKYNIVHQEE